MTAWLKTILQWLAAAMLLAIVLIVLGNVVLRYFFHIGLGWTEEASRFLLIAMTFVGAASAVKEWGHFQLLVAIRWIPARFHKAVQIFAVSIVAVMSALLVRYGISITHVSWLQTSPTMEWSMGYLYSIVPITGATMLLFSIEHLWNVIRGGVLSKRAPAHGAIDAKSSHQEESEQWL